MKESTTLIVAETPGYMRSIRGVLTDQENEDLIWHLAHYPDAGTIIGATGGVRKVRWATRGKGKSGSARIIYYYYSDDVPLFLLFAFSKSAQENLSDKEKSKLRVLTEELKREFRKEEKS